MEKNIIGLRYFLNGNFGPDPLPGQVLIGVTGGKYVPAFLTAGANITITESSGSVSIASSGGSGGSGYSTVQDEGTPLTQRSTLNFTGAGVTASDSGAVTTVNIPSGGGAPSTATYITKTPDAGLSAEQALSLLTSGLMVATTATGVVLSRVLTAGSTKISITNGDGISGNPTFDVTQANLDHGSIGGLADDDHTQYALLTGRAGGQTLNGGAASGENLNLSSTAHATKNLIRLGTLSAYDELNDRIGAGTLVPLNKFHSKSVNNADGFTAEVVATSANNPNIIFQKARGTIGAESVISNLDPLGFLLFRGYNSSYQDAAWIAVRASEAWGVGAQGTEMRFAVTPIGTTAASESMRLRSTGLSVKGNGTLAAPTVSLESQGTDAVLISKGTTAQAPAAVDGYLRYDTTTGKLRAVQGGVWVDVIGGGSFSATTIEANLGSTPVFQGKFTITDAAISSTSKVLCWQAPGPYTGKGTRADEASMQPVQVIAVEPAAGTATVYWQTPPMIGERLKNNETKINAGATFDRLANLRWPSEYSQVRIGKVRGNVKFSYSVAA